MANGYGEVTNAELARRMDDLKSGFSSLTKELNEGTQRVRHDHANTKLIVEGNKERIKAHDERLDHLESTQDKMLWAVIGAYGAVILALVVALIQKL